MQREAEVSDCAAQETDELILLTQPFPSTIMVHSSDESGARRVHTWF